MIPKTRWALLVALATAVPFAAVARRAGASPLQDPTCYHLAYAHTSRADEGIYAEYVAVYPGGERLVRSGMEDGRYSAFWWMFLDGATWSRSADTLELAFSNGSSGVLYKLTPSEPGVLRGKVWFLYDVTDRRPPPMETSATQIACEQAHLQSPPVAGEERKRALAPRRRGSPAA
jgi:hypothetical protein